MKSRIKRVLRPVKHVDSSDPAWYDQIWGGRRAGPTVHYTEIAYYESLWQPVGERLLAFDHLLEVGCGGGHFAHMLADLGVRGYTGFDFSAEAIAIAREQLPDADFRVADAMTTDLFTTVPYDAVVMTEVLEHLPDDLGLLERIRPGAHVFATLPSFDYPDHARYFPRSRDVEHRYQDALAGLSIESLRCAPLNGATFFLIHGVR